MRPHEGGDAPALTGTPPVTQPSADSHEGSRHFYCKPPTPDPRHSRRWNRRPHIDGWDIAVWIGFTLFCAMLIILACAVVWAVAP